MILNIKSVKIDYNNHNANFDYFNKIYTLNEINRNDKMLTFPLQTIGILQKMLDTQTLFSFDCIISE